jgi:hypothetical protein
MVRKLVRAAVWLVAIELAALIAGPAISKKLTRGDGDSNEFQVAAILGGKRFASHAPGLRSGSVITSMGGADIDLRHATLDAFGADLEVKTVMGGIRIVVPAGWAVDLAADTKAGGVEARVPPLESLPDDAPRLNVRAVARLGGVLVTTEI